MIQLRWDDKQARIKLAALEAALSGASLAAVIKGSYSPYIQSVTEGRFISQGDEAVGGKWVSLAPATRRIRARQGFPPARPINVRTGQLRRHVTQSTFAATAMSPNAVKMRYPGNEPTGELLNKMVIAQQGGTGSSGRPIPARPVLGFGAKDVGALLTIMQQHLIGVMRAA